MSSQSLQSAKVKITLEEVLRFKRREKPSAEFWEQFDRELRQKTLRALVDEKPWHQRYLTPIFGRLRRFFSFETINEEMGPADIVEALAVRTNSDKSALLSELQEKLNEALHKLSPKHRTVVVLFEIEELSHQEISEIMECSVGTVRSRLHYAKQQLQAYLQNYLS